MNKLLTKQLLLSSSYWVLNKDMVQIFGLESAFLLSNFAEAEKMMADSNGWFYQTSDTVEEMTTLTRHKQDQCVKRLIGINVLSKDVRGMPAKRYFKINYECLTNLIVNYQQTRLKDIDKLDCKKSATNKESINKESIKENTTTRSDVFKGIVDKFQNNGFGLINAGTRDILVDLADSYTDKWVSDAMDIAIESNVRKIGYVRGVLKKWETEGKDNTQKKQEGSLGVKPYDGNLGEREEDILCKMLKNSN